MIDARFRGICVGGSKDGHEMSAHEVVIRFPISDREPVGPFDHDVHKSVPLRYETYRWNGRAFIFESGDATYVSFLLGPVIDGQRRVEVIREFPTETQAKADAEMRLLMFGSAGWGRKTADLGPGKDIVVDVMGRL